MIPLKWRKIIVPYSENYDSKGQRAEDIVRMSFMKIGGNVTCFPKGSFADVTLKIDMAVQFKTELFLLQVKEGVGMNSSYPFENNRSKEDRLLCTEHREGIEKEAKKNGLKIHTAAIHVYDVMWKDIIDEKSMMAIVDDIRKLEVIDVDMTMRYISPLRKYLDKDPKFSKVERYIERRRKK